MPKTVFSPARVSVYFLQRLRCPFSEHDMLLDRVPGIRRVPLPVVTEPRTTGGGFSEAPSKAQPVLGGGGGGPGDPV